MWSKIMGVNSFVVLPAAFIFLIYAAGRAVFFLEWKLMLIALVIFLVALAAEAVLAILHG